MLILALESSAKAASVALCRDGVLIAQSQQCSGLTHSCTLLPMAEQMLKNTDTRLADVDAIAVARGPGSFTGVRIGVSTAKGLAWGAQKPAIGVSTLEAMAYHGLAAGEGALVCAAMDARRSQIYNALFEIRGGKPVRLCGDRAISSCMPGRILPMSIAPGAGIVVQKSAFLVGDGAQLCYNTCLDMGIPAVLAPGNLVSQSAWGVAMAAFGQTPAPAEELLPVYLRLSQAERERQARLAAQAAQE